ncbi:LemA family protein [Desulfovibrio sp. OttesenSCG-928-M14]|nr:LemA family protein [Desulfovibrio sp. OttesenSCG-928-M14]
MELGFWIPIGILVLLLLWVAVTFNRFVSLSRHVDEAWSGVLVQLKRRHDLIPNLLETVKAYMKHEKSTLAEVTALRSAAVDAVRDATAGRRGVSGADLGPLLAAEQALAPALGRLMMVAEQYPDLKASENFSYLQSALSEQEEQLQMARRYYNGTVRDYTILRESFPSLFVASAFKFGPRQFFELDSAAEAATPQVTL